MKVAAGKKQLIDLKNTYIIERFIFEVNNYIQHFITASRFYNKLAVTKNTTKYL